MYSEFDASEFDYLTVGNPQESQQQSQTTTPEISNIERFWMLTGNWGEFGSYRGRWSVCIAYRAGNSGSDSCCGDSDSCCWVGAGLLIHSLTVDGAAKLRSQLILIAVGTALLSANWDAWGAWIIANSQLLIFGFAVTVITLGFVGAQVWSKLNVNK